MPVKHFRPRCAKYSYEGLSDVDRNGALLMIAECTNDRARVRLRRNATQLHPEEMVLHFIQSVEMFPLIQRPPRPSTHTRRIDSERRRDPASHVTRGSLSRAFEPNG
ncbi:hypothetical protein EVAR_16623_1 [Eumeta japonica]|uniref:Uncharacterized protein n=1 Tax=Eumeta variegata TaxID=151549 RepID=A0A4C1V038_EUMVA|nr:hypothetical protein EVAR_16623_1 [Eumeta japonica]